jgi:hypothetical protein
MNPLHEWLYDNWKQVYDMRPGVDCDHQMAMVGRLARGNLHWLIRRLIGGVLSDQDEWIEKWIARGEMAPPSEFSRKRRYEALKRQNK